MDIKPGSAEPQLGTDSNGTVQNNMQCAKEMNNEGIEEKYSLNDINLILRFRRTTSVI